jgi:hypothetical protein
VNSVAVNCSSNTASGLAVHQLVDETFFDSIASLANRTKILFYCCGVATRTELVCVVGVIFHRFALFGFGLWKMHPKLAMVKTYGVCGARMKSFAFSHFFA